MISNEGVKGDIMIALPDVAEYRLRFQREQCVVRTPKSEWRNRSDGSGNSSIDSTT